MKITLMNGLVYEAINQKVLDDILRCGIQNYTANDGNDELGKILVLGLKTYELLINHHVFSPKGLDDCYLLPEIEKVFWEVDKSM